MDPDVALEKLRKALASYRKWSAQACDKQALNEADKVADHFEALDQWLSSGGFLPDEWSRPTGFR